MLNVSQWSASLFKCKYHKWFHYPCSNWAKWHEWWTKCLNSSSKLLTAFPPQDSKCLSMFRQIAFMGRQGGFCLQVAEALVNEQEACHTGAVLLCLSERINLCLSLPPLRGLPQAARCLGALSRTSIRYSGLCLACIFSMTCFAGVILY